MILTKDDIAQFEQRYRTAFVNSLAGFRSWISVIEAQGKGNSH